MLPVRIEILAPYKVEGIWISAVEKTVDDIIKQKLYRNVLELKILVEAAIKDLIPNAIVRFTDEWETMEYTRIFDRTYTVEY